MAKEVKSLKDIIAKDAKSAGRNIPKGEADFLDKHKVEKTQDANGNGDDIFNAKKVKPEEKSQIDAGKRHGYRGAEDVAAYEETIYEKGMECNKSSAKIYCPVHGKEECSGDVEKLRKESKDEREYDYEGDMAISQIKSIMNHSKQLMDMLKPDTNLPEWVQSKITLSKDYIQTAADYMSTEMKEGYVSYAQQKAVWATREDDGKGHPDNKKKKTNEETEEQIDEISKKLLGNYATKAVDDVSHDSFIAGGASQSRSSSKTAMDYDKKAIKRQKSVNLAINKLTGSAKVNASEEVEIDEVLKSSDPAGKWISDFVHSDNPKFAGKSKKERTKQALAAYYAKKRGK